MRTESTSLPFTVGKNAPAPKISATPVKQVVPKLSSLIGTKPTFTPSTAATPSMPKPVSPKAAAPKPMMNTNYTPRTPKSKMQGY